MYVCMYVHMYVYITYMYILCKYVYIRLISEVVNGGGCYLRKDIMRLMELPILMYRCVCIVCVYVCTYVRVYIHICTCVCM